MPSIATTPPVEVKPHSHSPPNKVYSILQLPWPPLKRTILLKLLNPPPANHPQPPPQGVFRPWNEPFISTLHTASGPIAATHHVPLHWFTRPYVRRRLYKQVYYSNSSHTFPYAESIARHQTLVRQPALVFPNTDNTFVAVPQPYYEFASALLLAPQYEEDRNADRIREVGIEVRITEDTFKALGSEDVLCIPCDFNMVNDIYLDIAGRPFNTYHINHPQPLLAYFSVEDLSGNEINSFFLRGKVHFYPEDDKIDFILRNEYTHHFLRTRPRRRFSSRSN